MPESIKQKEKQVELSRLKHTILEKELKLMRKLDEVERIKQEIENTKNTLNTKEGKDE